MRNAEHEGIMHEEIIMEGRIDARGYFRMEGSLHEEGIIGGRTDA